MQNKTQLDLIRNRDPNALNFVLEGRIVYYIVKRMVDFFFTFILLILFSPLMLFIAIVIFLFSPGPILYKQERVGARRQSCNGQLYWMRVKFQCYKFRTMEINADPSIHQAYIKALIESDENQMNKLQGQETNIRKLVSDPRVTRLGKFLRKFSLDELPQFWNVLKGDMSLVGPRPAIPYEVEMYEPWHLQRLQAQPGITGLQQVCARSSLDFDDQVQLDIDYIKLQSTWLDFKIMLKTPFVIFSTRGAQ